MEYFILLPNGFIKLNMLIAGTPKIVKWSGRLRKPKEGKRRSKEGRKWANLRRATENKMLLSA